MEKSQKTVGDGGLLNASQIAKRLNISKAFAYKLMQTGEIRTVKLMGARRVRPEDLEEYIESNLQPPLVY